MTIRNAAAAVLALAAMALLPATNLLAAETARNESKTTATDVVAKVNGATISRVDLDRAMKAASSQMYGATAAPQEMQTQILNQLIATELLYQAGKELTVKDLDKQAETRLAEFRKRFPTPEAFQKSLTTAGFTEAELPVLVRRDIIIKNLVEQRIAKDITISEADLKKFYEENIGQFKSPEAVRASHILITVDAKAGADEKQKAREKAEALRKRLQAGEDFAELAKKESGCPSSAQGGDLGFFSRGQMVPPFEKAAFALKPGEISEVVETQFGYHVIKLKERKEASTVPFADVKGRIEEFLRGQKLQKAVLDFADGLRKKATVELLLK